mgnify:CR=1 FL=1
MKLKGYKNKFNICQIPTPLRTICFLLYLRASDRILAIAEHKLPDNHDLSTLYIG